MPTSKDCILFEHFVKLLNSISKLQPRPVSTPLNASGTPKSLDFVHHWFTRVQEYYTTIPPHTCKIFFRLFFPEEDIRRRYNLKETTLARSLATDVFGLSTGASGAGKILTQWSEYPYTTEEAKLGCLGTEVEKVLSDRHSMRRGESPSIEKIDALLDELASLSGYSNLGKPTLPSHPKRARAAILRDLYLDLDPVEAKFLTQIILKDLRPVLYPLTETHTTRALLHYKSNAVHILTKWEVMKAWHPCMPRIYCARATLDEAARAVETLPPTNQAPQGHEAFSPILGIPIEIPKSQKGVKLSHALSFFSNCNAGDVWAETKYDGERMQIHVDLSQPAPRQITIFSKSKRNSTQDRMGTHPIIRAALGLPPCPRDHLQYPTLAERMGSMPASVNGSMILDAEMVPYSESKGDVDEFWRIRGLVESTAHGIRGAGYHGKRHIDGSDSQENGESDHEWSQELGSVIGGSLQSNASDNGDRHLKLVFFDVLFIDGSSLLDQPYHERRARLERLINVIPGYASLSMRYPISLSHGMQAAVKILAHVFSDHIANHREGLVLKASMSRYNSFSHPWVKLKRDYIPGYGDTLDLVILGAAWNKERARGLRVAPETFTSFFVAALEKPKAEHGLPHYTPQFQVLFTVEYGMDREQLETLNLYIKTSEPQPFREQMPGLPYQFRLPQGLAKPAFMFSRPLLGELFGAGFTKHTDAKYYSLRFPRLTKVWFADERNWMQGNDLDEFQNIARSSIGRESSDEWASRNVEAMWGGHAGPGPKDPRRVADASKQWHERLLQLEGLGLAIGADGETSSPVTNRLQNGSSSVRRKPSLAQGVKEPPSKRRKSQTVRPADQVQGLRALGSMTNIMRADATVQRQRQPAIMPHSPPITPAVLPRDPISQHKGNEHKGNDVERIRDVEITIQQAPITPVSLNRTASSQKTTENTSLSTPLIPWLHLSSSPTQPQNHLVSNPEFEIMSLARPSPPGEPLTPATSLQSTPPSQRHSRETNQDIAQFPDPYWPPKYAHTALSKFLQDAYVWIPRDSNNKRPANRPPALDLVPQNRRITVMYLLLIICGCKVNDIQRTADQFSHVNKCIVFLGTGSEPKVQETLNWYLNALESWRTELNEPGNKELFVFDSEMLTYESLATFQGDVVAQAIWRSSYIIK